VHGKAPDTIAGERPCPAIWPGRVAQAAMERKRWLATLHATEMPRLIGLERRLIFHRQQQGFVGEIEADFIQRKIRVV
jgi:hypothetical protein